MTEEKNQKNNRIDRSAGSDTDRQNGTETTGDKFAQVARKVSEDIESVSDEDPTAQEWNAGDVED